MRRSRRDDAAGGHLHRRGVAKLQGEGRGDANLARHRRRGRGGLLGCFGGPGRPRPRFDEIREIRRQSHRRSRPRAEDVRGATQSGALHPRVSTRVSVALERRANDAVARHRDARESIHHQSTRSNRGRVVPTRGVEKSTAEGNTFARRIVLVADDERPSVFSSTGDGERAVARDDERTPAGDPNRLDVEHERRRRRGRRVHGDRATAFHGERSAADGSAVHAQGPEDAKGALIRHGHLRRDEPERLGAGARARPKPYTDPAAVKQMRRSGDCDGVGRLQVHRRAAHPRRVRAPEKPPPESRGVLVRVRSRARVRARDGGVRDPERRDASEGKRAFQSGGGARAPRPGGETRGRRGRRPQSHRNVRVVGGDV